MTNSNEQPIQNPGSFRDPDGHVFLRGDAIYRSMSESAALAIAEAHAAGLLQSMQERGWLVETAAVRGDEERLLHQTLPGWRAFLRHERIPIISYPAEWSFSMLADAGLLHLRIQRELLGAGLALKDATAFNVQFRGSSPVFIDVGSIYKPPRLDLWVAYSQFCRMFLFPLALYAYRRISLKSMFLADINGVGVEEAYAGLGTMRALTPCFFVDLFLQHRFHKRGTAGAHEVKERLAQSGGNPEVQILNLERLGGKLKKLKGMDLSFGHWEDYAHDNTYDADAKAHKAGYIGRFMDSFAPKTVLDAGCNTGEYSLIAESKGAEVIAVDSDFNSVERLYRKARKDKLSILPLVVDITNPTPGQGFLNEERASFHERIEADAVLALALIHHLLVSARLGLTQIVELFGRLTRDLLVIEYVDLEDQMFQTLTALRAESYEHVTRDNFISAFGERFELIESEKVPGTKRELFTFRLARG